MEWNFTYENQEASSFLVYQLQKEEQLDTVGMGMLSNNQIPHILPVLYTQINENRYLRYAVPSRIPLDSFLDGMVSRERLLNVLTSICEAIEESQAYMLDSSMLVLDKRYIFANVTTGEVAMVYLPVLEQIKENFELCDFFKKIMFGTQFDSSEDCSYIATIINQLNKNGNFLVTDFKKMLQTLQDQGAKESHQEKVSMSDQRKQREIPRPVPRPKKAAEPPKPVPLSPKVEVPTRPEAVFKKPEIQTDADSKKSKGSVLPVFPSKKQIAIPAPQPVEPKSVTTPKKPVIAVPNRKYEESGFANFGETSVLNSDIGQTTVLGSNAEETEKTSAFLIQKKNGNRIKVDKLLFRIGKEKSFVDYWVSDNTAVSRSHADILNHEGNYYIRDNNSTNHTYLNGTMLTSNQEYSLKNGDQIVLGNEAFEFTLN